MMSSQKKMTSHSERLDFLAAAPEVRALELVSDGDKWLVEATSTDGTKHSGVYDGVCVAHGADQAFVGLHLKDVLRKIHVEGDGEALHKRFLAAAEAGGGFVSYNWRHDPNSAVKVKGAYIIKVKPHFGHDFTLPSNDRTLAADSRARRTALDSSSSSSSSTGSSADVPAVQSVTLRGLVVKPCDGSPCEAVSSASVCPTSSLSEVLHSVTVFLQLGHDVVRSAIPLSSSNGCPHPLVGQ